MYCADKLSLCCAECGKKLKRFTRKSDWSSRALHRTCWIKRKEEYNYRLAIEQCKVFKEETQKEIN